jgi:hypothetical protein
MVKWGLTAGSLPTHVRNPVGGTMFMFMNGNWSLLRPIKTAKSIFGKTKSEGTVSRAFQTSRAGLSNRFLAANDAQWRIYYDELVGAGVVDSSTKAGELRDNLKDVFGFEDIQTWQKDRVKRWTKDVHDIPSELYRAEDDILKVLMYESEKMKYMDAGVDESAAKAIGARNSQNLYPNYDRINSVVQGLRRSPLVGTFPSFVAETYRTTLNAIKLAHKEIHSGDPGIRKIGLHRALGIAQVAAIPTAAANYARVHYGISRKEDRAIKRGLGQFQNNSTILYTSPIQDDGTVSYWDMSYTDPASTFRNPLEAMLRPVYEEGVGGIERGVKDFLGEVLQDFLGEEVVTGFVADIVNNSDQFGREIYNPDLGFGSVVGGVAEEAADRLQPGTMKAIRNVGHAISGDYRADQLPYELGGEVKSALGFRVQRHNPRAGYQWRMGPIGSRLRSAEREIDDIVRSPDPVDDREIERAYLRLERARQRIVLDGISAVDDARVLGLDEDTIYEGLSSGLSTLDRDGIYDGYFTNRVFGPQYKVQVIEGLENRAPTYDRADTQYDMSTRRVDTLKDLSLKHDIGRRYLERR